MHIIHQFYPLAKGARSLISAAYHAARVQVDLDESIGALIDAMDDGCTLAKDHAPLKEVHTRSDTIARGILREVIKGAYIIRVFCEQRPESECTRYASTLS